MKQIIAALAAFILAAYLASSLNRSGFSQESPAPAPAKSPEQKVEALPNEFQTFLEPFIYDPKGRRDPFRPYVEMRAPEEGEIQGPLLPLQRFDLDEINLTGIIWDVRNPKAMFIDPNKQVHVLGRDERIGRNNGYIAVIREGEVVIVEAQRIRGETVYSTRVMRLTR